MGLIFVLKDCECLLFTQYREKFTGTYTRAFPMSLIIHIHRTREFSPRRIKSKGYTERASLFFFGGGPALTFYRLRAVGCLSAKYELVCSVLLGQKLGCELKAKGSFSFSYKCYSIKPL